ncbi:MAG: HAMP domain-containing histidine kinase [Proteobacteria bacterium]|nr:HAMP domain-containing histidine kinase [Pseudomonadota bacterium]
MCDGGDELNGWRSTQARLNKLFVHDFKNPISALSANLSFLDSALMSKSEDVRGAVSDSVLAAEMLLRFAENLNMIAMLEEGETGEAQQVNLQTFIQNLVRQNRKFASSAGVRLSIEEPLADSFICWQHRYAELAVENLISSAVRHSPQNSEVCISSTIDGNTVNISICDHGRPVDDAFVENLFTRKVQSEAKKHSGCRYGRGLGLYTAGLAARALGGSVTCGIRDGMTEFVLTCPLLTDE